MSLLRELKARIEPFKTKLATMITLPSLTIYIILLRRTYPTVKEAASTALTASSDVLDHIRLYFDDPWDLEELESPLARECMKYFFVFAGLAALQSLAGVLWPHVPLDALRAWSSGAARWTGRALVSSGRLAARNLWTLAVLQMALVSFAFCLFVRAYRGGGSGTVYLNSESLRGALNVVGGAARDSLILTLSVAHVEQVRAGREAEKKSPKSE